MATGTAPRSLAARAVQRYVTDARWLVEELDDDAVLTAVEGRHGAWTCLLTPLAEEELVLIESLAPAPCPAEKFPTMAELVTRLNAEVLLSVRATVDVEPLADLVPDAVAAAARLLATPIATNLATLDRWLPAVSVVLNGDTLPEEAVATVRAWPAAAPPRPATSPA